MRNVGLEEAQAGIKIARRNINNLRNADDTILTAESEEELKSLLMKVKVKSCPTLSDPMNCSLPGSLVHGILQARVLEWVPHLARNEGETDVERQGQGEAGRSIQLERRVRTRLPSAETARLLTPRPPPSRNLKRNRRRRPT